MIGQIYKKTMVSLLTKLVLLSSLVAIPLAVHANANDNGGPEWRGSIEARPDNGTTGEWKIGGRIFVANDQTQLEQEDGQLIIGSCAEVQYQVTGDGYYAEKIERKDDHDCNSQDGDGNGDGDSNNERERYGLIEQMPAGNRVGEWVIGGVAYLADANTRFEQEHGGFATSICVNVEVDTLPSGNTPATLAKIETEHSYKCSGNSDNGNDTSPDGHVAEFYGTVMSMPAGLIGTWTIGTMDLVADNGTRFEQEHGPLGEGVLVEVKFVTNASGVNQALTIESKYATDHDGHDDDGNGVHDGSDGHTYGKVGQMPTNGLVGQWTIAGLQYQVDADTRFEEHNGAITVGTNVKVEFYVDSSGNRIVTKIERTEENGDAESPEQIKLYGFIQQMPSGTFNGQWHINGIRLLADTGSLFAENYGLLVVGSYVEVTYTLLPNDTAVDGYLLSIETHVPPGAGLHTHAGEIEKTPTLAAVQQEFTVQPWIVGGRQFLVTSATDLNDLNSALVNGNSAVVNSYTNESGQEVATQIRSIVFSDSLFIPLIAR